MALEKQWVSRYGNLKMNNIIEGIIDRLEIRQRRGIETQITIG